MLFIFNISLVYANPVDKLGLLNTEQPLVVDKDIDTITNPPQSFNEDFLEYYSKLKPHKKLSNNNATPMNETLPHLYMLHINGINTANEDAIKNKERLEAVSQVSGTSIGNYQYVIWDFVYNPTGTTDKNIVVDKMHAAISTVENLIDVGWQKMWETSDRSTLTFQEYVRSYMSSQGIEMSDENFTRYLNDPKLITRFQDYIKFRGGFNTSFIVDEFHQKVPYKFASVMKLLADGNVKTTNGDYSKTNDGVVLIPHSQGNLYANTLFMYLTSEKIDRDQISIFGIASPADNNYATNWLTYSKAFFNQYVGKYTAVSYVTSCEDPVINSLRVSNTLIVEILRYVVSFGLVGFNGVAQCNAHSEGGGHNLIDEYLTDPELKTRVILGINEAAYMTDKEVMRSINHRTMMPMATTYQKNAPKVFATTFAYNQNVPQVMGLPYYDNSGNQNIQKVWDKDYDYNSNQSQLVTLLTPYLDDIVAKNPDNSGGHYPPALDHQAGIPNFDVVGVGYSANMRFYLFEDINDINNPIYNRIQMNPFNQYIRNTSTTFYSYGKEIYPNPYQKCEFMEDHPMGSYLPMPFYFSDTSIDMRYPGVKFAMNRVSIPGNSYNYLLGPCMNKMYLINGKYIPDGYFSAEPESFN
jgi:hypothetical protein